MTWRGFFFVSRWLAVRFLGWKKQKSKTNKTHVLHPGCQASGQKLPVAPCGVSPRKWPWLGATAAIDSVCPCLLQFQWRCRFVSTWKSLRGRREEGVALTKSRISEPRLGRRKRTEPSPTGSETQTELPGEKRTLGMKLFQSGSSTYFSLLHRHLLL